jgi:hypothetical protein|tara:strand:- start:83 stop:493 length:411 start_codon:yes stop_codon:yes gene_type:complete
MEKNERAEAYSAYLSGALSLYSNPEIIQTSGGTQRFVGFAQELPAKVRKVWLKTLQRLERPDDGTEREGRYEDWYNQNQSRGTTSANALGQFCDLTHWELYQAGSEGRSTIQLAKLYTKQLIELHKMQKDSKWQYP